MVAGIIFENKNVVDLVVVPDAAGQTEKKGEEVDEEVSGVDLDMSARLAAKHGLDMPAGDSLYSAQKCCHPYHASRLWCLPG